MLQASGRSYVCWRCAAQRLGPSPSSPWLRPPSVAGTLWKATQHANPATHRRNLAIVRHVNSNYGAPNGSSAAEQDPSRRTPTRERLLKWEAENPTEAEMMMSDFADDGGLTNILTRAQNGNIVPLEVEDSSPLFADDELVDLRSEDAMLDPGDLVELTSNESRRPALAICLGRVNGYEHFYTTSGQWFSAMGIKTLFVVKKFATPDELQPIIEALPPTSIPIEDLNILQDLGEGPSRSAGAVLLRKMLSFTQESEAVYQANAGTLDASSSFIGDAIKHQYLTLHEIADLLLPVTEKYGGKFSPHSLYAVHRALLQDEVFFRPLRHTGHRRSYLFEVSSLEEVRRIQGVEKLVRVYLDKQGDYQNTPSTAFSPIESFLNKARAIIDESRKKREWSDNGIIGPSSKPVRVQLKPNWTPTDREILQFIELWASYQKFPPYSRLQTLGSALLRAMGRYQGAGGYLPATGWTFLQEVGWIPPWEIPARYTVRLPDVTIKRGGSYERPFMGVLERQLKRDMLGPIRKSLDDVTAYCIDDITAREIDDAVSLEKTQNPEEYWVHVHVADPASSFGADTPLAKYAELIPEAIYLPGHLEPMLPETLVHDRFSLAPDRFCLTFSALVNTQGTVLNEKITANVLTNVIYMTYEDAALAIGETREDLYTEGVEWGLGTRPETKTVNKEMTRPDNLTESQKSDLAILSKLGKVIQAGRLAKGAIPFFQPRPTATVGFDVVKRTEAEDFIAVSGDPTIHIHYSQRSGADLVENAMKLANEVAARWCYERGIPIPYRTQPHALRNAALVQQYTRDILNPMLNSGVNPDEQVWRHMQSLVGVDEISTTPGPHFTLGSDMYTKATSPLRRFGDLIVHWQIEAALLEEKRLGRRLIKNTPEKAGDDFSFLPFSRNRINRMLPMIRLRERQVRALTNVDGTDQWILQALVRAWRFKEASLPETFKLTVSQLSRSRILGRLDWFGRAAILKHDALNNVTVSDEVRLGDVIEVRLTDVNVHSRQIFVEALRVIEKAKDRKRGLESLQVPLDDAKAKDTPVETI